MRNNDTTVRTRTHTLQLLALLAAATTTLGSACTKDKKDDAAQKTPATQPSTPSTGDKAGTEPVTPPAAGANSLASAAGTYDIDNAHSSVIFRISHFGLSNFYGRFNKVTGTFTLDADLAKSAVDLTIDATSVFTADKKRDDHLKSPDFFNVQQFPNITFKSTAIESTGDKQYKVTGDLTLHGVTKSVSATLEHIGSGPHPADPATFVSGFEGALDFKRSDFDMNYMAGALGDEIHVILAIEGGRK